MNFKNLSTLLLGLIGVCAVTLVGCKKDKPNEDGSGGGGGGGNEVIDDPDDVAHFMNDNMILPPGSFTVDPDTAEIDMSVEITSTGSDPIVGLYGGEQMTNEISFTAPNGNVSAVGMRFGPTGPIHFVPIDAQGATSGTGSFDFMVTPDICSNLSSICHDIWCYEFAMTDAGAISTENIQDVAMMCGNCDEPSCVNTGLIDPVDCSGGGNPGFQLVWDNVNHDLDLNIEHEQSGLSEYEADTYFLDDLSQATEYAIFNDGPVGEYLIEIWDNGTDWPIPPISYTLQIYDNNTLVEEYNATLEGEDWYHNYTYNKPN